jgi:hypothetical protein
MLWVVKTLNPEFRYRRSLLTGCSGVKYVHTVLTGCKLASYLDSMECDQAVRCSARSIKVEERALTWHHSSRTAPKRGHTEWL